MFLEEKKDQVLNEFEADQYYRTFSKAFNHPQRNQFCLDSAASPLSGFILLEYSLR